MGYFNCIKGFQVNKHLEDFFRIFFSCNETSEERRHTYT